MTQPPIIIISGAIGSGKGTVLRVIVKDLKLEGVPTHTTRAKRHDDAALSQRIFDTEATFKEHLSNGDFIEYIQTGGNYYGLLRQDLEDALAKNQPLLIEMDVEGAGKVVALYPNNTLRIFLQADEAIRRARIQHRGMPETEIELRMQESDKEEAIAVKEYDHLVENKENLPEHAIETIKKIIINRFPELKNRG